MQGRGRKLSSSPKKLWVAISTPFQVNFFYPLIKRLEKKFEFVIAARDHDRILSMLDAKGLDYFAVGEHGGSKLEGKLRSYARNVERLIPFVKAEKPDLLLTERWPEAVRVAFGFDIPSWTIYYDERERHVNRMVFPLSEKVFVPDFYTSSELEKDGVNPKRIVWFRGFHTCYMKNQEVNSKNPFRELGVEPPIVLVRPEPEFASFFSKKQNIMERAVSLLMNNNDNLGMDPNIIVLPRTQKQASSYARYAVTVMTKSIPENPVLYADVTMGAAETMLMEAFVVGKPTISTVYWQESKPLAALHKYIPHLNDPKAVAAKTLQYLNAEDQAEFYKNSRLVVDSMDNPIDKFEEEIMRLCAEPKLEHAHKRRSRIEIYVDIIEAISFRSLILTHIMQEANLSHSRAKRCIRILRRKGLIKECSEPNAERSFEATPEGLRVAADYRKVEDRLS